MKTMERGHEVLHLNAAGRNLAHLLAEGAGHPGTHPASQNIENLTTTAVMVPLLIVLLTIVTLAVQYYLMVSHGHFPSNLPTFVDVPFALSQFFS